MKKWTLERWFMIATALFIAGGQWATVWYQQARVDKLQQFNETTLQQEYVRRDVYVAERAALKDSLDELKQSVDRQTDAMIQLLQRDRRTDSLQRQFDK